MPKRWDNSLRQMIRDNPYAFIELLEAVGQVELLGQLPEKLKTWNLEVDALVEVLTKDEKRMLIHFEFQTKNDATMPERLLRYNVLARSEYGLPVLTCVFYLRRDGNVKTPPLLWSVPLEDFQVLRFHYVVVEVAKLSPQQIRALGYPALLPLLPLTQGGATREVVSEMLDHLVSQGKDELAEIGFSFAWLVFNQTNPQNSDWLKGRYKRMFEILREDDLYQEILKEGYTEGHTEGLAKGHAEGRVEGHTEGRIEGLQLAIIDTVATLFPELEHLAQRQIPLVHDDKRLKNLNTSLCKAADTQEAQKILLAIKNNNA